MPSGRLATSCATHSPESSSMTWLTAPGSSSKNQLTSHVVFALMPGTAWLSRRKFVVVASVPEADSVAANPSAVACSWNTSARLRRLSSVVREGWYLSRMWRACTLSPLLSSKRSSTLIRCQP